MLRIFLGVTILKTVLIDTKNIGIEGISTKDIGIRVTYIEAVNIGGACIKSFCF